MLEARGAVRVMLSNGVEVDGDACVINLALQRFVVAGHVTAFTPAGRYSGAAFAEFLTFRRSYFIPLVMPPIAGHFSTMITLIRRRVVRCPATPFFLPDFSGLQPFIIGTTARIDVNNYIEFAPPAVCFLGRSVFNAAVAGLCPQFRQSEFFGQLACRRNFRPALWRRRFIRLAGHGASPLRPQRKTYGSFEHHSVFGSHDYAVFSLNPATQPSKQWNLLGYLGGDAAAFNVNAQLFTYQYGLTQPLSSNGFADGQYTKALRNLPATGSHPIV